jgi:hypothetical protein
VDSKLAEAYDLMQSKLVLQLGLLFSHPDPDYKPNMWFVCQVLSRDISLPSFPTSKLEISYTWKNTSLITGGGVGGVLPIKESTSMVGSKAHGCLHLIQFFLHVSVIIKCLFVSCSLRLNTIA